MRLGIPFSKSRQTPRRTKNHLRKRCARRLTFQPLESRQLLTVVPLFESGVTLPLETINSTETTGEKPQSKVWQHDDKWWAVLPQDSGTWLWRLESQAWNPVLQLSSRTGVQADVKPLNDQAHVLLFGGVSSELVSLAYDEADPAGYHQMWAGPVPVSLSSGVETATLDIDSDQRMWIASDANNTVEVRYSDFPYANFSAPITVGSGINSDDISVITSLPTGQIGVLWSNQPDERFVFRYHVDGTAPDQWSAIEYAAQQSALSVGNGMADDHLNVAVASDGTLYAAVKTSYDSQSTPSVALLVRRPEGTWDPLYPVDTSGTRPIVLLNEQLGSVLVAYTEATGGGDIVYRESDISNIQFGNKTTVLPGGLNDVSSTRESFGDELVFISSKGTTVHGAWLSSVAPPPPPPPPATITVALRDGVNGYHGTRDTKIKAETPAINYGYDAFLEIDGSPDEATLLGWDITSIQPGSRVQSASITLYATNRSDNEYGLFELLRDWSENEATWERYSSSQSWESAGIQGTSDFAAQNLATFVPESLGSVTVELNAAGVALVQSWIDSPSSNRGILVQGYDSSNGAAFSSRETGTVDRRPQLTIQVEDVDTPPPDDPTNEAPVVVAGADQTVYSGSDAVLDAAVQDDGLPGASLTVQWSVVSGPDGVTFADATSAATTVSIATPGTYILELTASDGELQSSDTLTVEVLDQPQATGGLAGAWFFDESSGETAFDSSGLSNHGVLVGSPLHTTGPVGSALALDGLDDQVLISDDASLDGQDSITIAAWLRPEVQATQYAISKATKGAVDGFEISLSSQGTVFARFNENTNGNAYRVDTTTDYPTDGATWMHVAATYDGASIRIYVNGQLEGSTDATFQLADNNVALSFGSQHDGLRPMQGGIDDVHLFQRRCPQRK